jgi:S-adenosylmethionine:tRNA ribosyltransferase-isomerase
LHLTDFDYSLPAELIAEHPTAERTGSRLLALNRCTGEATHKQFSELLNLLEANDLLVFNNTKVLPARLVGQKESGGKIELLLERILGDGSALVRLKSNHPIQQGLQLSFSAQDNSSLVLTVLERQDGFFKVMALGEGKLLEFLQKAGHTPLPSYIKRQDQLLDRERYQTVYARHLGAVAAPTAGLHFDEKMLKQLSAKGVDSTFVTLHVGAGTYQPVRTEDPREHIMHAEYMQVTEDNCAAVARCKAKGGKVVAVGTTSVRCLETAGSSGELKPYNGDTRIFIYPGYKFQIVEGLLTNFHLPQSSLLMLVSAFSNRDFIMAAYSLAVAERYRFFSYGDAMLIL